MGELRSCVFEPRAVALHDALSGALLNHVPLGEVARRRYGAPYAVIRRTDLHSVLLASAKREARIALRFGAGVSDIQDDDRQITFSAGGERHAADVLVAADGVGSRLRTGYFGHPGPRTLSKTAWRATLPIEAVPKKVARDVTGLWMGPGAHLVHYPLCAGAEMNLVVIASAASTNGPPLQGFGEACRELIQAAPEWRRWPLQQHDAAEWVRGGAVLIGDAAHAMLPSAAQGGAQAVEDAWVLAESLAAQPGCPRGALTHFEQSRRGRIRRITRQSRRNLKLYELGGLAAALRNGAIRAIPESAHLARLDWLYGWRPQSEKA
jgi:salicylate hydroxylase